MHGCTCRACAQTNMHTCKHTYTHMQQHMPPQTQAHTQTQAGSQLSTPSLAVPHRDAFSSNLPYLLLHSLDMHVIQGYVVSGGGQNQWSSHVMPWILHTAYCLFKFLLFYQTAAGPQDLLLHQTRTLHGRCLPPSSHSYVLQPDSRSATRNANGVVDACPSRHPFLYTAAGPQDLILHQKRTLHGRWSHRSPLQGRCRQRSHTTSPRRSSSGQRAEWPLPVIYEPEPVQRGQGMIGRGELPIQLQAQTASCTRT